MCLSQEPSPTRPGLGTAAGGADPAPTADHPHNFDLQKDLHQKIRNDPDYDDWEYGTEPLPHESEAWIAERSPADPLN